MKIINIEKIWAHLRSVGVRSVEKYKELSLKFKITTAVLLFSFVVISFASIIILNKRLEPVENVQKDTFNDYKTNEYKSSSNEEVGDHEPNSWDEYDCDEGLSKCKNECGYVTITDPENGEEVESNDFESNCEDACRSGYNACDGEKNENMCDDFESICKRNCPDSVHDDNSGNDISSSEAEEGCEDACKKGANECEI